MLSKLLGFLGGFKTKIIIIVVAVLACYGGYRYVYNTGYNAGVGYISAVSYTHLRAHET